MCVEATFVARQKFIRPVVRQPDIVATSWPTQKRGSSNFEALLPFLNGSIKGSLNISLSPEILDYPDKDLTNANDPRGWKELE